MVVEFLRKEKVGENLYSYYFSKPIHFNYLAGQYVQIQYHHDNADDRGTKRWFTLSSSPLDNYLKITTKHSLKSSSFKEALFKPTPAKQLKISPAYGDFVLPKNQKQKLVFLVGGIGITPVLSILSTLLKENNKNYNIDIVYLVSNLKEKISLDIYKPYINKLTIIDTSKLNSLYTSQELINYLKQNKIDQYLIYISGPEKMVENLTEGLIKLKVPKHKIISDYFENYSEFS